MAQCSKCSSQDMEWKAGMSKAGKPYKGWKCNTCKNFDFVNDPKPAFKPQTAPQITQPVVPKQDNLRAEAWRIALKIVEVSNNSAPERTYQTPSEVFTEAQGIVKHVIIDLKGVSAPIQPIVNDNQDLPF